MYVVVFYGLTDIILPSLFYVPVHVAEDSFFAPVVVIVNLDGYFTIAEHTCSRS